MSKMVAIEAPVLVIGFNRPEVLRQCIAELRKSEPTHVYFACDGPRAGKEGEELLVKEVQEIMEKEVDWPCETHYRYNSKNQGCAVTVSEAIGWVLEHNDYVIIIEDDIIASRAFLSFAQEMLIMYRDDERIYQVSSENATPIPFNNDEDYCFSMYGHIWGWATWKRAWNNFDLYVHDFDVTLRCISERTDLTPSERVYLRKMCRHFIHQDKRNGNAGRRGSWAVVWNYIKWRDGGLSIVPRAHLSSNIGVDGLHTVGQSADHYRSYDEGFKVSRHPHVVTRNIAYDKYHYKTYIEEGPYLVRQMKRVVGYVRRRYS